MNAMMCASSLHALLPNRCTVGGTPGGLQIALQCDLEGPVRRRHGCYEKYYMMKLGMILVLVSCIQILAAAGGYFGPIRDAIGVAAILIT